MGSKTEFASIEEELKFMADCADNNDDNEQSLMYMRYLAHIRKLNDQLSKVRTDAAAQAAIIQDVHSWIVCAAIASPDDMMQNAEHVATITTPPEQGWYAAVTLPSFNCYRADIALELRAATAQYLRSIGVTVADDIVMMPQVQGWKFVPVDATPAHYKAMLGRDQLMNMDKKPYEYWAAQYKLAVAAAPEYTGL